MKPRRHEIGLGAIAAKPDPLVLDLARALGAIHGSRQTPATWRAVFVAQQAIRLSPHPRTSAPPSRIDPHVRGRLRGKPGDRVLWYELGDIVEATAC